MVRLLPSKQRRKMWSVTISGFWQEYSHNKIGIVGLGIVIFYAFVAVFANLLTPYDPSKDLALADGYAPPVWIKIFPGSRSLPQTMDLQLSWSASNLPTSMNLVEGGRNIVIEYNGTTTQTANLTSFFLYPYDAPNRFRVVFDWSAQDVAAARYSIELYIMNPVGEEYIVWTSYTYPALPLWSINKTLTSVNIYSTSLQEHIKTRLGLTGVQNLARDRVFTELGEYKFIFRIKVAPTSGTGVATIRIQNCNLKIFGVVHGLLGTDYMGADVFSQIVYGTRISLAVGLVSAILSTSIGILVGTVAGYVGGFVDEGLMRTVDILLCLPVLPLLLGLVVVFGTNVWYLVLLIALFGWLGLSRIIRSSVLSLKEMPFIECARAAGASRLYIMTKHVIPNILPVALAALILGVPAAILTEAGISFIGLGDPLYPTWGRTLHWAFQAGAFSNLSWWWIIPPGLAITILTLSFVFIGHAVDEIINPRLRRRR